MKRKSLIMETRFKNLSRKRESVRNSQKRQKLAGIKPSSCSAHDEELVDAVHLVSLLTSLWSYVKLAKFYWKSLIKFEKYFLKNVKIPDFLRTWEKKWLEDLFKELKL